MQETSHGPNTSHILVYFNVEHFNQIHQSLGSYFHPWLQRHMLYIH